MSQPGVPTDQDLDLAIVGGGVFDPATAITTPCDIGVGGGVVTVMGRAVRDLPARTVVDARGCLVTPGLVDLHTHVFAGGTFWGTEPAAVAWRSGVTSLVDAGSAGAFTFPAFRKLVVERAPVRVYAFLNISGRGLVTETGEGRDLASCQPEWCAGTLLAHPDVLVGVKCRLDRFAADDLEPLRRAVAAATSAGVPVMAHIGAGPPSLDAVLEQLRPGDIVTHCMTGQSMSLVDRRGKVRESVRHARQRGVLFDVGHGSGAFSFPVATALVDDGFLPDVISSDLHQRSVLGPAFDLPTCMSKLLAVGMTLEEVLRATTAAPAAAIGRPKLGQALAVGSRADIAVLELVEGDFVLYDVELAPRRTGRLVVARATVAGGHLLTPRPLEPPAPWTLTTEAQRHLTGEEGLSREPPAVRLSKASDFIAMELEANALTESARHDQRPGASAARLRHSVYCFASDLLDEGTDTVLTNIQERAGVDGVTLAAKYHAARDIYPHNPRRRVAQVKPGIFYRSGRPPGEGQWSPGPDDDVDVLGETCAAAARQGMRVDAWVVALHADEPGHEASQEENCFGDRYGGTLCPSSPEARALGGALAEDILAYPVETLRLESLHFHGLAHGHHHERQLEDFGPAVLCALALCFCAHCRGAAWADGVDADALAARTRGALTKALEEAHPPTEFSPDVMVEMCGPDVLAYTQVRARTVARLAASITTLAHARGKRVTFIDPTVAATGGYESGKVSGPALAATWQSGISQDLLAATGTSIEVTGYFADPGQLYEYLQGCQASTPAPRSSAPSPASGGQGARAGGEVSVVLRPGPPDCREAANLAAKMERARQAGCREVNFYNYGVYRLNALDRVAQAVSAAAGG